MGRKIGSYDAGDRLGPAGEVGLRNTGKPESTPPQAVKPANRRLLRAFAGIAVVSVLSFSAFFVGRIAATELEVDRRETNASDGIAAPVDPAVGEDPATDDPVLEDPVADDPVADDTAVDETAADVTALEAPASVEDPVPGASAGSEEKPADTLRFVPFDESKPLIRTETSPELNNSVGIAATESGGSDTAAVVSDLVVRGPAGSIVAVHPGDRPADAVRFTVPASGRLLVPHLMTPVDDYGRVVVSADNQVTVEMDGIGRFVPADQARAGRFVPTGSVRIGSLVTATDGRTLVMDLAETLGAEADHVGHAIVRLNANVGRDGGSVAVGSGPPIPWPGPASPDFGLAGTELLTVTPEDGVITMEYLGGSVMVVEMVGYYTNDLAPEADGGLLILASPPEVRTIEIGGDAKATGEEVILPAGQAAGTAVAVIEAVNGATGGSLTFWTDPNPMPGSVAFALAPGQQRSTTEWFDPADNTARVNGPQGTTLQVWHVGTFTPASGVAE